MAFQGLPSKRAPYTFSPRSAVTPVAALVRLAARLTAALGVMAAVASTSCSRKANVQVAVEPSGEIAVGKAPPHFTVTASDGTKLDTNELRGRPVVVYFYPKDETPGCTKQACGFRDAWADLAKTNVVLIGVSGDSDESHRAFQAHHNLPFHLVSDGNGDLAKSFGVPMLGRQSFVIGVDGAVKKIYRSVDVATHARDILADISQ